MDETTLSGETTLSLNCSWCADDVAIGMVHGVKMFCDFRSSILNNFGNYYVYMMSDLAQRSVGCTESL